jgi:hypothetical protein
MKATQTALAAQNVSWPNPVQAAITLSNQSSPSVIPTGTVQLDVDGGASAGGQTLTGSLVNVEGVGCIAVRAGEGVARVFVESSYLPGSELHLLDRKRVSGLRLIGVDIVQNKSVYAPFFMVRMNSSRPIRPLAAH